jgi:plasmid stabilization system protein ParE
LSRTIIFLPAARFEVIEAFDWYENLAPGLGNTFQSQLDRQIARILDNPLQFPVLIADVRRARLKQFPYALFFRTSEKEISVIACFHASRDPQIWEDRP